MCTLLCLTTSFQLQSSVLNHRWSQTAPPAGLHTEKCSSSWCSCKVPANAQKPGCQSLEETENRWKVWTTKKEWKTLNWCWYLNIWFLPQHKQKLHGVCWWPAPAPRNIVLERNEPPPPLRYSVQRPSSVKYIKDFMFDLKMTSHTSCVYLSHVIWRLRCS